MRIRPTLQGIWHQTQDFVANGIGWLRGLAQPPPSQAAQLEALIPAGVEVSDVIVELGAPVVNRLIKDIPFPQDCLIACVRRGKQVFIPRGETALQAGDILVVVTDGAAREAICQLCQQPDGELS